MKFNYINIKNNLEESLINTNKIYYLVIEVILDTNANLLHEPLSEIPPRIQMLATLAPMRR